MKHSLLLLLLCLITTSIQASLLLASNTDLGDNVEKIKRGRPGYDLLGSNFEMQTNCDPIPDCDDNNCMTIDTFIEETCSCNHVLAFANCALPQETITLQGCGADAIPPPEEDVNVIFDNIPECDFMFDNTELEISPICQSGFPLFAIRLYRLGIDANGDGELTADEANFTCVETYNILGADLSMNRDDVVINCDEVDLNPPVLPQPSEFCAEVPSVVFSESIEGENCLGGYDIIRSWTATDICQNTSVHVQTVSVLQCEPPNCDDGNCATADTYDLDICECVSTPTTIPTCIDPQLETVILEGCGIEAVPAAATEVSLIFAELPTDCGVLFGHNDFVTSEICNEVVPFSLTRIYFVGVDVDGDGLISEEETLNTCQETYIIRDTTAPIIENAPADETILCGDEPAAITLIITDCDTNPTIVYDEVVNTPLCIESYTIDRMWTVTDACGNETIHTQVVTVAACDPPSCDDNDCTTTDSFDAEICDCVYEPVAQPTCRFSQDTQFIEGCGLESVPAPLATAEEVLEGLPTGCDLLFEVNDFSTGELCSAGVPLQVTRIYTLAVDQNGNGAIDAGEVIQECEQIYVVQDTTAPIIENAPADETILCGALPAVVTLMLTDCDANPTIVYNEVENTPLCIESYTIDRMWTVTDACGNETIHTQIVTVAACDPPVCNDNDCTTIDSFDAAICDCVYEAVAQPTCRFSQDTQFIEGCGLESVPAPLATAEEVLEGLPTGCDLLFEVNDFSTGELCSAGVPLQVTRIYTLAVDQNGNGAIDAGEVIQECEQIYVVQDTTAPAFDALPLNAFTSCDNVDAIPPAVLTATDACGTIEVLFEEENDVASCLGGYDITRTWTATDDCGNTTVHTQTITVEVCEAPSCDDNDCNTADVYNTMTCECENNPIAPGSCDDEDCNTDDVYNTVTCECENTPITPPSCDDGNCLTIDTYDPATCGCVYEPVATPTCLFSQDTQFIEGCGLESIPAALPTAEEILEGLPTGCDLLFEVNDFSTGELCSAGVPLQVTRIYTLAVDQNGNGAIDAGEEIQACEQIYVVQDTTAPTFDSLPADTTISCDEVDATPTPVFTATDACGTVVILFDEDNTGENCLGGYDITRTWTATDDCGNTAVHTQTITVEVCEAPSCDDEDCTTADVYNTATCECENNPIAPGSCDDQDCTTTDVYNTATCECENTAIEAPSCDDADCTTEDEYNVTICECEHTPIAPPSCDDENCTTTDVYNTATCECENTAIEAPSCDDADCTTEDLYNVSICKCEHTPITVPSCDDEDCTTADVYNTETCECENNPIAPGSCDDEDCATADVYNTVTCECENNPIAPGSCDDQDCTTSDIYNTATCECENTPIDAPTCLLSPDTQPTEGCDPSDYPKPYTDVNDVFGNVIEACGYLFGVTDYTTGSYCNAVVPDQMTRIYQLVNDVDGDGLIDPAIDIVVLECPEVYVLIDTTAPELFDTPGDATVACNEALPTLASVIATDNCDPNVVLSYQEEFLGSGCLGGYDVTRTWTATDLCGNEAVYVQTISVATCPAPTCDDSDVCTTDSYDNNTCDCINTPIANCGECDPLKIVVEEITEPSCYGESDGMIDIDVPCFDGGGTVEVVNLAVNRSATQSSTWSGAVAGLAVDGTTNGDWYQANSVSGTNWSVQPWWQVDLGSVQSIDYVEIWGRTDCCQDFLSDYYVFVSDNPISTGNVATLLGTAGVDSYYFAGPGATPETANVFSTGRYVRVMLNGNHLLQLAEVKVFGKAVVGSAGCNFSYAWSDGLPATQDQSGLPAGTYSVTVTNDDTGCNESLEIPIGQPSEMTCYLVEKNPISENGGSNGAIGAWVDGGVGPFNYSWNNGATTSINNNISAGSYQATIVDAQGCTCTTETHILTEPDPIVEEGNCENPTNLALDQPATQSSTQVGAVASRANDGNTDGNFWATNSVTLTNWSYQPWWEVELQENCSIDAIYIYNRTDSNEDFLSNYWVLISDTPNPSFGDPGVTAISQSGTAGTPTIIPVNGTGKYVRIQLQGSAFLAIAEVEVYGCCEGSTGPSCVTGATCSDGDDCTTGDVYDEDCNCVGTFLDTDEDGVCDVEDTCPGFDDLLDINENGIPDGCDVPAACIVGNPCDDNDSCTTGDVYDEDCNCAGTFADADNDGICDVEDECPGYDDTLDINENGTPDDCETSTGPSETCDVTIQVVGNSIVIDNINNPINYIKVYDSNGSLWGICNNDCNLTEIYSALPDGDYLVDVETFNAGWSFICDFEEVVTIGGSSSGYCDSYGATTSYEWIDQVNLNSMVNASGNDDGYGDFTSTVVNTTAGSYLSITLTPGYSAAALNEYWAVYVDWNNDLDFNDLDENPAIVSGLGTVTTGFNIPSHALNGQHRVRIVMSAIDDLLPCEGYGYGETEDYTINVAGAIPLIDENSNIAEPVFLRIQPESGFTVYPNPATDDLYLNLTSFEGLDVNIEISNLFGQSKFSYQTENLDKDRIKINLNNFKNGLFTVSVNSSKRQRVTKQFIIAKTY